MTSNKKLDLRIAIDIHDSVHGLIQYVQNNF